jgi:hypothetical protein
MVYYHRTELLFRHPLAHDLVIACINWHQNWVKGTIRVSENFLEHVYNRYLFQLYGGLLKP